MIKSASLHQSYQTVLALSQALQSKLSGAYLENAYTLSKEEIVLNWRKDNEVFVINIIIRNQTCYWLLKDFVSLKPSNAQPVFETLNQQMVQDVLHHKGNRSFSILFNAELELAFKCYNGLSNIVLFQNGNPVEIFRNNIQRDLTETLSQLTTSINVVENHQDEILETFVVAEREDAYPKYQFLFSKPELGKVICETNNVFEAYTVFSKYSLQYIAFQLQKQQCLQQTQAELKRTEKLIAQTLKAIEYKKNEISPEQLANILMANLNADIEHKNVLELFNFYTSEPVTIQLKRNQSLQDLAAHLYRKGKTENQALIILNKKTETASQKLKQLQEQLVVIESAKSSKQLKPFLAEVEKKDEAFLFRKFVEHGFEIWVGKSAANNDVLTQKYAHKNDMWLHAKDVSGSHVIIKQQSGSPFTKQIIERAAQLAAYYSKLKGSGLVPVAYTLKKYVRKPKGFPPGAVVLDKEEVIMVEPKLHFTSTT